VQSTLHVSAYTGHTQFVLRELNLRSLKISPQILEKSSNIKFHVKKTAQWELSCSMRTDRKTDERADMTKLIYKLFAILRMRVTSTISGTFRPASPDHSLVKLQNMNVINVRSRLRSVTNSFISSRRCPLAIALWYWHVRGEIAWLCPSDWAGGTRTGTPTQIDSGWLNVPVLQICSNLKE